jgi:hypothetical protein
MSVAPSASAVASALSLDSSYEPWLDSLAAVGLPPHPPHLPGGGPESAQLLARLGFVEQDLTDTLAAQSAFTRRLEADERIRWLFDRAYHAVLVEIGNLDASRRTPALPDHLGLAGRVFWVMVYLAAVDDIRAWHRLHGISDQVSTDTLTDLGRQVRIFRERNGRVGLDTQWWLSLHFRGAIFALGRLQFNPYRLRTGPAGPLFWYEDEPTLRQLGGAFRPGAPVLGVHIPETGPLTPEACDVSFAAAGEFFATHFPSLSSNLAVCTSWLLDEQLAEYLPATSNIVRFQRRFTLVPGAREDDASPFYFIFGKNPTLAAQSPPRTSLEQALLDHLRTGRHWNLRTGWLRLPP